MRINQAHVTSLMFKKPFMEKYKLSDISSLNKSAVFFGIYSKIVNRVMQIQAPVVCIWAGTDLLHAMNNRNIYAPLFARNDIRHIVLSAVSRMTLGLIERSYARFFDVHHIPITPFDYSEFTIKPMGKVAYCYAPDKNSWIYNQDLAMAIENLCKIQNTPFKTQMGNSIQRSFMPDVYADAFCNIRLTVHDGLPNTVVEMALMGRRSLWNGDPYFPGIRQWHNLPHILQFIFDEKHRKEPDFELRESTLDYLNVGDNWLNV